MRKRVAYISFPTEHGNTLDVLSNQKVLDGLNIRFSATVHSQAGIPAEARIEVYNLNRKDLQFLSTCAATWAQKQTLFQLYAGYEGDVKMIYSGQIMEAIPGSYPDVILSVRGISDIKWWGHNIEFQKSNVTVMDLIDYAAKEMGYEVNIDDNLRKNNPLLNKSRDDISFQGSPMELLEKAQSMVGGVSGDPQTVFINTANGQINIWSPSVSSGRAKLVISKKTGMIGLPSPTGTGCEVKILMNNGIKTGDIVELQSERVDVLNTDYYVIAITHEGELRGNTWYSTLKCARVSNYKSNKDE